MNSSIAWPYDSWELAAGSEFKTAFFDCSKSGSAKYRFGLRPFRHLLFARHTGGLLGSGPVWRAGLPIRDDTSAVLWTPCQTCRLHSRVDLRSEYRSLRVFLSDSATPGNSKPGRRKA